MRLPKPKRTKDKALLKELRLGHCELCGKADDIGVHHIITRNAGVVVRAIRRRVGV